MVALASAVASGTNRTRVLKIETLGRLSLQFDGREIVLPSRKAQALIGYLALSDSGEETRERLVGLLWSEIDHVRARASLRQCIRDIRKALEGTDYEGFSTSKIGVKFDQSLIDVDVRNILSAVRSGGSHFALERRELHMALLEQLEFVDQAFNVWLRATRHTLGNKLTTCLEDILRHSDVPRVQREQAARALINLEPTHEEAVREVIHCRALAGDMGGALRVYDELWQVLGEIYDVEPSPETQQLIADLKLGHVNVPGNAAVSQNPALNVTTMQQLIPREHPAEPTPRVLPKLRIAVAPFDLWGTSGRSQHVAQGFRRDLIACLVRFREWGLRDLSISDTGEARSPLLPGEYVIEGSATEFDGNIRFTLFLRDIAKNEYLWSEQVDLSLSNWFQVQQLVVRRITTVLNVHLSVGRMAAIADQAVTDWRAFDLWLLGQATLLSYDQKKWDSAADLFQQAIQEMPDFAPAYSSLAQLHNGRHIAMPGVFRDAARTDDALKCARMAAKLDPVDSRSHLCLGWSHAMSKQYEQAMIYMPLAYELNSNDPWTMISTANCFAFCGEYGRANEIAQHALELPIAPSNLQWSYHVAIRFMSGDYEGCVEAADLVDGVNPNVPGYKSAALYHLGRVDEAKAELKQFFAAVRGRWVNDEPSTDEAITRWFLTMFPIASPDDWERLRQGLAGAGAPTEGLHHHQW